MRMISRVSLNKEVQDVQKWGVDASGSFSVRSAYCCLANHGCSSHDSICKQLCQSKAFSNVLTKLHGGSFG